MTNSTAVQTLPKAEGVNPFNRAEDRCDVGNCGAQAFIRATKVRVEELDVLTLLWCNHHGKAATVALLDQGFEIEDYSHLINVRPASGITGEV